MQVSSLLNEGPAPVGNTSVNVQSTPAQNPETMEPKQRILEEILSYEENEYHKILAIGEEYESVDLELAAVERAVYDRGTMVHPKHNNDGRAEQAWRLLHRAGTELGCRDSTFKEVEDFVDLADDSEFESENGGDPMESEPTHPPSRIIREFYNEATPWIKELQKQPRSHSTKRKLSKVNDKIRQKNAEEGQDNIDRWIIDVDKIAEFYIDGQRHYDRLKAGDVNAGQQFADLNKEISKYIKDHHYPHWEIFEHILETRSPVLRRQPLPRGAQGTGSAAQGASQAAQGASQAAQRASQAAQGAAPVAQRAVPILEAVWRPGLTLKRERILGMIPLERTDVDNNKCMLKCTFLVEKKGQIIPMAYEDSGKVGKEASQAYRRLPESERKDLRTSRNQYTSADQEGFIKIVAIVSKRGHNNSIYPHCHIWAKYEDEIGDKYLNRTGFRSIWGAEADRMIEDFYISNQLDIPWEKRARRSHNRSGRGRAFLKSPVSTRSPSLSLSSYPSDAGLEQVTERLSNRALEARMLRIEELLLETIRTKPSHSSRRRG